MALSWWRDERKRGAGQAEMEDKRDDMPRNVRGGGGDGCSHTN
jgi:hypothetical protein